MTRAVQLAGLGSLEGSAPAYACRAWVNFDGTSPVVIRSSGNVSSITDNGSNYYVNFSTAMPDAKYACTYGTSYRINNGYVQGAQIPWGVYSTTQVGIQPFSGDAPYGDAQFISVAIFR